MRSALRLLCLGLAFSGVAAWSCELRITWKHEPPYQYEDEQHRLSGLQIEVARAVLARLHCRLLPVELAFARAMTELEAGRVDIVPGVLPTAERERFARFSLPGVRTRNLVFLRSDPAGPPLATLDELHAADLRVGVERGTAYRAELKARLGRRLEEATSLASLLRMLHMQRIDAFVGDEYSTAYMAQQLGLTPFVRASAIVIDNEAPVYAFSRLSVGAELVERFNAALEALRRDGTLTRLEARFLQAPPAPRR